MEFGKFTNLEISNGESKKRKPVFHRKVYLLMCGIVGVLYPKGASVEHETIHKMTSMLAHRGPDELNVNIWENVGFGHSRLSIIDLAGGSQPMTSANDRYAIVYNGEIFNYIELRDDLEARGVRFRTKSDTEVLLEGFSQFGIEFFAKCNGQFALAIYDKTEERLILARDRMGEKPLYFANTHAVFAFSSEVKSLIAYLQNHEQTTLSSSAIWHFLSLNYVPFDQTFIEEVSALPPGHCGQYHDGKFKSFPYIECAQVRVFGSTDDYLDRFKVVLDDATKIRLRADVPVGLFLSGGIDSTVIANSMANNECDCKAYIANFREKTFSEANQAVRSCEQLNLAYEIFDIDPLDFDVPSLISELVYHGDQPLADSSALAVYLLSKHASEHVKVVLTGDGGDELFGGYITNNATLLAAALPRHLRNAFSSFMPLVRMMPAGNRKVGFWEKVERFLRSVDLPPGVAHFAWNGMFGKEEKLKLVNPLLLERINTQCTFESLADEFSVDAQKPNLSELLLADQRGYLPNDILRKVDTMTMAHGLEARPVFLDHRLVELARGLPLTSFGPLFQRKKILRQYIFEALPALMPPSKKQGFSIPVHLWFRTVLRDFAGDMFHSDFAKNADIYNTAYLHKLWNEHLNRERNLGFELWGILVSLLWIKRFYRGVQNTNVVATHRNV